jgi:hypothetical protein
VALALTRRSSLATVAYSLQERKFFDSGDYALSKAGKTSDTGITLQTGKSHPLLKNISHLSSPVPSDSNVIQDADLQQQGQKSPSPVEAHFHSHLHGQRSAAADGVAGMKQNESEDYILAKENVN